MFSGHLEDREHSHGLRNNAFFGKVRHREKKTQLPKLYARATARIQLGPAWVFSVTSRVALAPDLQLQCMQRLWFARSRPL